MTDRSETVRHKTLNASLSPRATGQADCSLPDACQLAGRQPAPHLAESLVEVRDGAGEARDSVGLLARSVRRQEVGVGSVRSADRRLQRGPRRDRTLRPGRGLRRRRLSVRRDLPRDSAGDAAHCLRERELPERPLLQQRGVHSGDCSVQAGRSGLHLHSARLVRAAGAGLVVALHHAPRAGRNQSQPQRTRGPRISGFRAGHEHAGGDALASEGRGAGRGVQHLLARRGRHPRGDAGRDARRPRLRRLSDLDRSQPHVVAHGAERERQRRDCRRRLHGHRRSLLHHGRLESL